MQVRDNQAAYTASAKRAANLSVNAELLEQAKALRINLSATLEQALAAEVRARRRQQWLEENREAIAAYNEHVREHGIWSDGLRGF
ncbi:MAG: type II toxin-antitoxin system CcdA family antitoxin [Pseudomonadales bacterium]|nr:type II toxin-antitoxin system CcdA family antitoxin [Pseudomonadales bacterium]